MFLPQDALRGRAPRQNLGNVTRVGGGGPDAADSRSAGALIGVGIGLGVIHVLTGPDHVSAIVTLSVGGSFRAFWLGVRWGLGHSVGLLLMYSVFVEFGSSALQGNSTMAVLAHATVGVFMIVLGITGCNSAFKQVIRLYVHMCVHVCVCVCVCARARVCVLRRLCLYHIHTTCLHAGNMRSEGHCDQRGTVIGGALGSEGCSVRRSALIGGVL